MSDEELPVSIVDRPAVDVLLLRTTDDQAGITRAWADLENRVGSLRGRKFYGAFYPGTKEYLVCVEPQPGDDAERLGLEASTLPGGRYARMRLRGEPPGLYSRIAPAFTRLAERPDHDPARPEIEFYRSRDEVDLLEPIA